MSEPNYDPADETPEGPEGPRPDQVELVMLRATLQRLTRTVDELTAKQTVAPRDLDAVQDQVRRLGTQRREVLPPTEFYAQITGYGTSGTPYKWQEMWAASAGMVAFTSGIVCSSASDIGAAIEANGQTFVASGTNVLMRRYENASAFKFVFTAPVKPSASIIPGHITAVPADAVSAGNYTLLLDDGRSVLAKNGMEAVNGTPGKLGIDVDGDGTVTGTTCVVKPLGVGAYVLAWRDLAGHWWFSAPNSAETP